MAAGVGNALLVKVLGEISNLKVSMAAVRAEVTATSTTVEQANKKMATSEREHARTLNESVRAAFSKRGALGDLLQTMSGAAAIASLFARNNDELRRSLEVASLTIAGTTTLMRTFVTVIRLVSSSMVLLTTVGIGALIAGAILLIRNWEAVKEATIRIWNSVKVFLLQLWQGVATAAKGYAEIVIGALTLDVGRIMRGWNQLREGLSQMANTTLEIGKTIGAAAVVLWGKLKDLLGAKPEAAGKGIVTASERAMDAIQRWQARQEAFANTIDDTEQRLLRLIEVKEESIDRYNAMAKVVAKTQQEKMAFKNAVAVLRDQLISLNDQLAEEVKKLDAVRAAQAALSRQRIGLRSETELEDAFMRQAAARTAAQKAQADAEVKLREDTADLIAKANEQSIERQEQKEKEAFENTKRLIAEEATARMDGVQARLEAVDVAAQIATSEGRTTREIWGQQLKTLNEIIAALQQRRQELLAFKASIAGLTPEEREPFQPLLDELDALDKLLVRLGIRVKTIGAEFKNILTPVQQHLKNVLEPAFTDLFTNILDGAKDFGTSLVDFFRNIVNQVISLLAGIAAKWLVSWILRIPFKLFGGGGIIEGGLSSMRALQGGGIIDRPTVALMGERRGKKEAVVPLEGNRFIPAVVTEPTASQPTELVINLYNVMDMRAIRHTPGQVTAVVVDDLNRRGVIFGAARVVLPGR